MSAAALPGWQFLAVNAISDQARGQHHRVAENVTALMSEHAEHLPAVLDLWCSAGAVARFIPRGYPVHLGFHTPDGDATDTDGVDPAVLWAWRVFAAYVAKDPGTIDALLATVPPAHLRVHLLAAVAATAELVSPHGPVTATLVTV